MTGHDQQLPVRSRSLSVVLPRWEGRIAKGLLRATKPLRGKYVRAVGAVSLVYGINIVLGLVRDMVFSARFGATESLDVLLIGLNAVKPLGERITIATSGALVPAVVPLAGENLADLVALIRRWLRDVGIVVALASVLLAVFASPVAALLAPGLSVHGRETLALVVTALIPVLTVFSLTGLTKAVADTYGLYALHPLLVGATTAGLIVGVLLGARSGVVAAAIGMAIAAVLGIGVQAVLIVARTPLRSHWRDLFRKTGGPSAQAGLDRVYRGTALLLGSSFILQLQSIVERSLVSQLPAGSVSALSLAQSVMNLPATLLLPAVSSVMLPYLVRRNAAGERSFRFGLPVRHLTLLLVVFSIAVAGIWTCSDFLMRLLFMRGQFTAEDAARTAEALRWISLAFPMYVIRTILRQVVIAREAVKYDLANSIAVLGLKIAMLTVFVPLYGIKGLAGVMVMEMTLSSIAYVWALRRAR